MRFLALVLLLLALPLDAGAREDAPPVLKEGPRVRVTLLARDASKLIGPVLSLTVDSLVVAAEPDSSAHFIARLDVKKLEVSRGMKSNAGRGATIGAIAGGLLLGLSVASVASSDGTSDDSVPVGIAGGVVGALGGAGLGALIGSASKHERWDDVGVRR